MNFYCVDFDVAKAKTTTEQEKINEQFDSRCVTCDVNTYENLCKQLHALPQLVTFTILLHPHQHYYFSSARAEIHTTLNNLVQQHVTHSGLIMCAQTMLTFDLISIGFARRHEKCVFH